MSQFKVAVFSSKPYDKKSFHTFQSEHVTFEFFDVRLTEHSVNLAQDFDAICAFVHDELTPSILEKLNEFGIKGIALR